MELIVGYRDPQEGEDRSFFRETLRRLSVLARGACPSLPKSGDTTTHCPPDRHPWTAGSSVWCPPRPRWTLSCESDPGSWGFSFARPRPACPERSRRVVLDLFHRGQRCLRGAAAGVHEGGPRLSGSVRPASLPVHYAFMGLLGGFLGRFMKEVSWVAQGREKAVMGLYGCRIFRTHNAISASHL